MMPQTETIKLERSLEQEHAEVYNELLQTIDKLLVKTKQKSLFQQLQTTTNKTTIQNNYTKIIETDIDYAMLHQSISNPNYEADKGSLVNDFLKQMLELRLRILKQHHITYPYLKAIHSVTKTDNDDENNDTTMTQSMINENKLLELANTKDKLNIELLGRMNINKKTLMLESRESRTKLNEQLKKLQLLSEEYLNLVSTNKDLKFQNLVNDEDVLKSNQLGELKLKYKNMIKKSIILSNFNISMISSLSNVDLYSDEQLIEWLLYCGEYECYDLDQLDEDE